MTSLYLVYAKKEYFDHIVVVSVPTPIISFLLGRIKIPLSNERDLFFVELAVICNSTETTWL